MPKNTRRKTSTKKTVIPVVAVLILFCAVLILAWPKHSSQSIQSTVLTKETLAGAFDKNRYPTDQPSSTWIIVNKKHQLMPASYAPDDLVYPKVPLRDPGNESMQMRAESASALETMFAGATKDGLGLKLSSGFRSYSYQVNLYGSYVKSQGQSAADKISARPGYSEHQTGLAADIEPLSRQCEIVECFADTPEGKWLAANSYKYGFIMRYTKDKIPVTGYDYEPWHFRYVGVDLATQMHNQNIETLEEFFGVSGGAY